MDVKQGSGFVCGCLINAFSWIWSFLQVTPMASNGEELDMIVWVRSKKKGRWTLKNICSISDSHHVDDDITYRELEVQKQDTLHMESNRGNNNNLLEYLRSLESSMVLELSQPSSAEVKEVIHELVQSTIQKFFKQDSPSEPIENTTIGSMKDHQVGNSEASETFTISRDHLAKLLFWCMLLGHHLRGLENRLHLSCVVGLL